MEPPCFTKTTQMELGKAFMDLLPPSASITHQYATACQSLHGQRKIVAQLLDRDWDHIQHRDAARDNLVSYYNQISSAPLSNVMTASSNVRVKGFEWRDGLGFAQKCKDKCGRLELCNVVYNIGVASCCLAAEIYLGAQRPDRLVTCKQTFTEAASAFDYCIELIQEGGFDPPYNPAKVNLEMRVESLRAMSGCMAAYAMRCVYEKAVEGGKSFSVFTKVALLCALTYDRSVELLKDAMAACGKSHVRWLTGWRFYMENEGNYFQAQARIHSSDHAMSQGDPAKALCHLRLAKTLLDTVYSFSNSTNSKLGGGGVMMKKHRPSLLQYTTGIQTKLNVLQRDIAAMVYGAQPDMTASDCPLPTPAELSVAPKKHFREAFKSESTPLLFGSVKFEGGRARRDQSAASESSSSSEDDDEAQNNASDVAAPSSSEEDTEEIGANRQQQRPPPPAWTPPAGDSDAPGTSLLGGTGNGGATHARDNSASRVSEPSQPPSRQPPSVPRPSAALRTDNTSLLGATAGGTSPPAAVLPARKQASLSVPSSSSMSAAQRLELDARGIVQGGASAGIGGGEGVRGSLRGGVVGGKGGIVDDDEVGVDPAAASQATRELAEARRRRELSMMAAEKRAREDAEEERKAEEVRRAEERRREEEAYMEARSRERRERESREGSAEPPVDAPSHATIQRQRNHEQAQQEQGSGGGIGGARGEPRGSGVGTIVGVSADAKPGDVVAPGYLLGGHVDGIPYYVCEATKESVWELPSADHLGAVMVMQARDPGATLKPGDPVAEGYVFGGYAQGLPFYVCEATCQSVWELPSASPVRAQPSSSAEGELDGSRESTEEEDRLLAERLQRQFMLEDGGEEGSQRAEDERAHLGREGAQRAGDEGAQAQDGGDAAQQVVEEDERVKRYLEMEERAKKIMKDAEDKMRMAEEREKESAQKRQNEASEERKKAYGGGDSVPNEYLCPITMEIMVDPVIAMDGHTYERAAIENWLQRSQKSPKTNVLLPSKLLVQNHSLRAMIGEWKESNRQR